ncbi:MAG: hypothetical protein SPJ34_03520 [Candidatus Ornithospirochaeta sp.]|nr:hypothetical protein [Candidatus Ornithospirochaeta sp.]
MKKALAILLIALIALSCVFANGSNESAAPAKAPAKAEAKAEPAQGKYGDLDDLSKNVTLRMNISLGNRSRTITYNQGTPLTLSNGEVVTAGMIKPVWQRIGSILNISFNDVAIQDAKATDMIKTESTSGFSGANVYCGNSIATDFMNYGAQGRFVNILDLTEGGYMPNFKAYLEKNPNVKAAITAYDGNIYYIPYVAEIGNFARVVTMRETWVKDLLDKQGAKYDENDFTVYYQAYYAGDNARVGANGGTVSPKDGITVTKKTADSIIEIQNSLPVKNGKTLTEAFISYIKANYDYENPSELFLGEKAAYDIDELIALFRCIKANPGYLTAGKAKEVWPLFTRQSSYREDIIRFSTWWDGTRVNGTDSYESRWEFNNEGKLEYTYSKEGVYNNLVRISQLSAEGLIYRDCYDLTRKGNHRTTLYGTDNSENPSYGFMTYDWIASTTADALNKDIVVALPPVAKVNGVWQYYIDNTRAIKPDGWAISAAGTNEEIKRAATLFDFFFTEDGRILQNYGLTEDVDTVDLYQGPGGTVWPKYKDFTVETANKVAKGDVSVFLRDWMGSHIPVGYIKEIGFEYQSTSERGFAGWDLILRSTTSMPSYSGEGKKGDNPYYYTQTPSAFSLTLRQQETLAANSSLGGVDEVEYMFNIIRYGAQNNAPAGVTLPKDYSEYLAYFQSKGLDIYQQTYQTAYINMQMNK